jgi:alpha-galactosidase
MIKKPHIKSFVSVWWLWWLLLVLFSIHHHHHHVVLVVVALNNGLGRIPPMGWNSWNQFRCNVSEALILSMANRIVELGLDTVGYRYVNLDDCWMAPHRTIRNEQDDGWGELVNNPTTFPHGMKYIGDYLHNRSLLFWHLLECRNVYLCRHGLSRLSGLRIYRCPNVCQLGRGLSKV